MKKLLLIALLTTATLSACGSSEAVEVPVTQIVKQTIEVLVTVEVLVEVTVEVPLEITRIVEVTSKPTATPLGPTATPTITPTTRPTWTPNPTIDVTRTDKDSGSYLVGSEIAPGIWRSVVASSDRDCYLEISTLGGRLVNNTFDPLGGTIRIPDGEYLVVIPSGGSGCIWTFFQP